MYLTVLLSLLVASPADARAIADFQLQDFRGAAHKLSDYKEKDAVVVVFTGVECPLARMYGPRLAEIAKRFAEKRVGFLVVDSNEQDGVAAMKRFAESTGFSFPFLKDVGNVVADQFDAKRTPEAFLLDSNRVVRYRGRIDDQYGVGYQRPRATQNFLADALEAVLARRPVKESVVEAVGCPIGRVHRAAPGEKAAATYSNQVSRLLEQHCVECHRPGAIAPFSLTDYKQASGWAQAILEVVEDLRMPPWLANPKHGKFKNDARLSDAEKETIRAWVRAGAPEGDRKDLPKPKAWAEGWRIPEPDLIVRMPEAYAVKADGSVPYQYFEVDPGFKEDRWVKAAEARPGNRSVDHHIIVFVKPPNGVTATKTPGVEADWLTATAPGSLPLVLPEGYAKFIPAGSKFVFQMHYTPNGTKQQDQSSVALVFADPKTVKKEVATGKAHNDRFLLWPKKNDQKVEASKQFSESIELLAMFPHMHLRGKAFRYEVFYPNGDSEILLDVPRFDFAWQNGYILQEPKRIPAGSTIKCTALYDNSDKNLSNPNPNGYVRWGDQTWEEMMIGYFDATLADQDLTASRVAKFDANAKAGPLLTPELKTLARRADNPEGIERLGEAVRKAAPQVDRIDVMTVDGKSIRILASTKYAVPRRLAAIAQYPIANLDRRFGKIGDEAQMAKIIKDAKPLVSPDLRKADGWDLHFLAYSYRSGLHVPATREGKPVVVNFWSRDADAFPPAAVDFLKQLVKETPLR